MKPLLVIGNRNYSSWSLRGYLPLAAAGIDFDEKLIVLDTPSSKQALRELSPSGKVPVLMLPSNGGPAVDGDAVWESLAIAEFAAEASPSLWPADARTRARARSVAAEMHAGFSALRRDMPMNIRGRYPGVGRSPEALADARRILELWDDLRGRYNGKFLFGDTFTVADAMFAPVATRFVTYAVEMNATALEYVGALTEFEPMAAWIAAARDEPWTCPVSEPGSSSWQGGPLRS